MAVSTHCGFTIQQRQEDYRTSMHCCNSHQFRAASVREAVRLAGPNVTYTALETLSPAAFALLNLRDVLGLRSCFNTVQRMWNPAQAPATVQGVIHTAYRNLQAQAAEMLGQKDLSIIKGGGGEFERHPLKDIVVFGLRDGAHIQHRSTPLLQEVRRVHESDDAIDLQGLWHGHVDDPFAVATITGTAALALWTLKAAPTFVEAEDIARKLWARRHSSETLLKESHFA